MAWLPVVAFGFGLLVGSFLNVVIHRLPREESLVRPPSHCPACGRPVRPHENLPLLSYLWLRGRCRGCGVRIPLRYPAVELATGLLFAGVALRHGPELWTPVACAFAAALLAAAVIDAEHRIIPDSISLGGLALGLVVVPLLRMREGTPPGEALLLSAAGALLGGGLLWSVGFAHARLSAATGRSFEHWPEPDEDFPRPRSLDYWVWFPGLGFGDVKLLAMVGAFLGPVGTIETILAASLAGLAFGLVRAAWVRSFDSPFGFGPAIAAGALWVLLSPVRILPYG